MLQSRALKLFRILVPSWGFFDAPGIEPYVLHRSGSSESTLGSWRETLPRPTRLPTNLFLNSRNNLLIAYYTLVLQFLDDLAEVNPVSYELVSRMVREFVEEGEVFQWKLVVEGEDLFLSDTERVKIK